MVNDCIGNHKSEYFLGIFKQFYSSVEIEKVKKNINKKVLKWHKVYGFVLIYKYVFCEI